MSGPAGGGAGCCSPAGVIASRGGWAGGAGGAGEAAGSSMADVRGVTLPCLRCVCLERGLSIRGRVSCLARSHAGEWEGKVVGETARRCRDHLREGGTGPAGDDGVNHTTYQGVTTRRISVP